MTNTADHPPTGHYPDAHRVLVRVPHVETRQMLHQRRDALGGLTHVSLPGEPLDFPAQRRRLLEPIQAEASAKSMPGGNDPVDRSVFHGVSEIGDLGSLSVEKGRDKIANAGI